MIVFSFSIKFCAFDRIFTLLSIDWKDSFQKAITWPLKTHYNTSFKEQQQFYLNFERWNNNFAKKVKLITENGGKNTIILVVKQIFVLILIDNSLEDSFGTDGYAKTDWSNFNYTKRNHILSFTLLKLIIPDSFYDKKNLSNGSKLKKSKLF